MLSNYHTTLENMSTPKTTTTKQLTLIVAATDSTLGIGRNGTLPWRLKADLAYFARVTTRRSTVNSTAKNAVIMGRKTWFSIPPRFRPLRDRINIVLSRNTDLDLGVDGEDVAMTASSLDDALGKLKLHSSDENGVNSGKVFVIGGAEIYKLAIRHPDVCNALLTRVFDEGKSFECDTFFPLDLKGENGWFKRDWEMLCEFVGEAVPKGLQTEKTTENGTIEYEYEMWEKQ
jgi:dihydrofolate reductase